MAWTGLALTVEGQNALNKAQVSNKMNIKSIVVGDGATPQNFRTLKGLVNQLYEITDLKIDMTVDGCTITADFPKVDYDYYFREIGVIVTTDEGDILYVYDNCGDDAQYVVNSTGVENTKKRMRLLLTVSDVAEITVSASNILYVAYDDFEKEIKSLHDTKVSKDGGDASDLIVDFEESGKLESISKDEPLSGILGKTAKAVSSLIAHLADKVIHITAAERTNWNDANSKKHAHGNKATLDAITAAFTTGEKNKLSGIETGAQKNTVTGIKGNAEGSYRTGNVNITPANIGLGNVNNTADANKSVALASRVKDAGDGRQLSFNYSASELNYNNYTWLAVWNGNTLQTANKNQFAVTGHTHDDRYYTESEVNSKLNGKANSSHSHNDYLPINGNVAASIMGISDTGAWLDLVYNGTNRASLFANGNSSTSVVLRSNVGGNIDLETDGTIHCLKRGGGSHNVIWASAFNTQSSRRYKKNIIDITNERAQELLRYRVVTYDYINETDGTDCLGLIAEEVADIEEYPVYRNADGEIEGLDYSKFVPQLIRMVQLQQEEIAQLKEDIKQLRRAGQKGGMQDEANQVIQ